MSVPANAVKPIGRGKFYRIGCKGLVGGRGQLGLKKRCHTSREDRERLCLNEGGDHRMIRGPMKWVDPDWNSRGEGDDLAFIDAEQRKCRE